jgi:hypothetical protein
LIEVRTIRVFNISSNNKEMGMRVWLRYRYGEPRQFYLLAESIIRKRKIITTYARKEEVVPAMADYQFLVLPIRAIKTTVVGFNIKKMEIPEEEEYIFSFVILQVEQKQPKNKIKTTSSNTVMANDIVTEAYLSARLQALVNLIIRTTRQAYLQALHSTCNAMNEIIQLTQAAVTEHPTMAARHLINATNIHARSSGHLLEVWPCKEVEQATILPMPEGICSSRIPIRYLFLDKWNRGFMDTHTNIIYRHHKEAPCSTTQNIPFVWQGNYMSYNKGGNLTALSNVEALTWTPFKHENLQGPTTTVIFKQIQLYTQDQLTSIAIQDYIMSSTQQAQVLQKLGLPIYRYAEESNSSKHHQAEFASNIVDQGLFGFLYGLQLSYVQIWVFLCCIATTITVIRNIGVTCCIKPMKKRFRYKYKQYAIQLREENPISKYKKRSSRKREPKDMEEGSSVGSESQDCRIGTAPNKEEINDNIVCPPYVPQQPLN